MKTSRITTMLVFATLAATGILAAAPTASADDSGFCQFRTRNLGDLYVDDGLSVWITWNPVGVHATADPEVEWGGSIHVSCFAGRVDFMIHG